MRLGLVAGRATGPPADATVEQPVLHVLGDLTGDEGLAVRPMLDPPSAFGHRIFEHVDGVRGVEAARGQVVQHPGARLQQGVGAHPPIVPGRARRAGTLWDVRPLLEVIALGPGDAAGAQQGGADRLEVVADMDSDGLTPSVDTVRDLKRECDLPLRVMLRANDGFSTSGSELTRLQGAAHQLAEAGADGFVLGFLGPTVEIDVDATLALADEFGSLPWTFHRAIDHALDYDRAWQRLRMMPRLDTVLTAGSARGVSAGLDDLCRRASDDAEVAQLMMAGGGLVADHVPWLARAGVRKFHVGSRVRPSGSWKAYVDASMVRSWRTLVDDAVAAAL